MFFARFVALSGDVSDVLLYDLSCETNGSVHHHCGLSGCLVPFNNNKDFKFYLQPNRDVNTISSGALECLFCYFIFQTRASFSDDLYFILDGSHCCATLTCERTFIFHSAKIYFPSSMESIVVYPDPPKISM